MFGIMKIYLQKLNKDVIASESRQSRDERGNLMRLLRSFHFLAMTLCVTFYFSFFTSSVEAKFLFFDRKKTEAKIKQEQVRKNLENKELDERLKSISQAGANKDKKAVNGLIKILKNDENPVARQYACESLAKIKDKTVIPQFLGLALEEEDPAVIIGIVDAIRSIGGEEAVSALITIYEEDEYPGVRVMVVNSIGIFKGKNAEEFLKKASYEESSMIRRSAVRALGNRGDKKSVLKALDDMDEGVRIEAVDALGLMGDVEKIKELENSAEEKIRKKAKSHLKRWRK